MWGFGFFSLLSAQQGFGGTRRVQEHQTIPDSERDGGRRHTSHQGLMSPALAVSSQLEIQAMGTAGTLA